VPLFWHRDLKFHYPEFFFRISRIAVQRRRGQRRDVEGPIELVRADAAVSEENLGAELFATITVRFA
jgi:hypothetical protein